MQSLSSNHTLSGEKSEKTSEGTHVCVDFTAAGGVWVTAVNYR